MSFFYINILYTAAVCTLLQFKLKSAAIYMTNHFVKCSLYDEVVYEYHRLTTGKIDNGNEMESQQYYTQFR